MLRRLSIRGRIVALMLLPVFAMVGGAAYFALSQKVTLEAELRDGLRRTVDIAIASMQQARQNAASVGATAAEAEAAALAELARLRFSDGEYFFAARGVTMLTHPDPTFVGRNMADFEDAEGVRIVSELAAGVDATGEAFVQYLWAKPGATAATPKLSHARRLPGSEIWIGTGVHLDVFSQRLFLAIALAFAATGAAILAIGGAALMIANSLVGPLGRVRARMASLAEGDVAAEVPETTAPDEIGEMARGVERFRQNALEVQRLTAEHQAAEARAAAERGATLAALGRAFGEVVEAAVAGDFSRRVAQDFDDAMLTKLADDINRLVGALGDGVSDAARVVAALAEGDLTERMDGDYEGAFLGLQADVNAMADRLADMATRLQAAAAETADGAGRIAGGARELSRRAEGQATSLAQSVGTMAQMSTVVKQTARHAESARELSHQTAERAEVGRAALEEVRSAMTRIERRSGEIAAITSTISDIAFQTNLLALNAAVEAARAGEAGRGFSVVAAEVRALAQRASDAARDIAERIEAGGAEVKNGAELVSRAGDVIDDNLRGVVEGAEMIDAISKAMRDQSTGVGEVVSALNHLETLTQATSSIADAAAGDGRTLDDQARAMVAIAQFFKIAAAAPLGRAA